MPTYTVVDDPDNPEPMQHPGITLVDHDGGPYNPATSIPDGTYVQPGWGVERVTALIHKLRSGVDSCGIQLLGDSTGLANPGWFLGLTAWLAEQFPAYSFSTRQWNDVTDSYGLPGTTLGTAGRRRLIGADIGTDYYMTVPDSAATSITGDIDVRVRVQLPTITPAINSALASKFTTTGNQRSWFLDLQTTGKLAFFWSVDGIASLNRVATVALPAGIANGLYWLRATLDVDNGAAGHDVKFYYSQDAVTWTQIGTTVTTAGTTSIFDGTSTTQFNGRGSTANGTGAMGAAGAEYHHLVVIPGLTNGAPVVDLVTGIWNGLGTGGFNDFAGNVVTVGGSTGSIAGAPICMVMNGSASGQAIAYSNDATRFAKQTPFPCDVSYISYGHNEGSTLAYRTAYKQLIDALVAKWPDTGIVAVAQNPKLSPATFISNHAVRAAVIASLAVSQRHGLLDVFRALQSLGSFAAYVDAADGIHPTTLGYEFWRDEAKRMYRAADRLLALAA